MRCRQNVALLPARTSLSSVGWDAIHPPQHRHHCHCCPTISTIAHHRYLPNADPGHTHRQRRSPSSAHCRSRLAERSPSASSHVAVICGGVGCDPPSSTSSSLLPSRRNLHCRPFPVSARRVPQTHLLMCSLLSTVWHVLLLPPCVVIVVVVSMSSQERRRHSPWQRMTTRCRPSSLAARRATRAHP